MAIDLAIINPATLREEENNSRRNRVITDIFYPLHVHHGVAVMDLQTETFSPEVRSLLPDIYQLAALGDALRALQMPDGRFLNPQAANTLFQQSVELLIGIANAFSGPTAQVLRMRAQTLCESKQPEAAIKQVEVANADAPLILLCGPLSTWRGKSKYNLYSVVASVPISTLNALIVQADSFLNANLRYLQTTLGFPSLEINTVPSFLVTEIMACGGEANAYPKQFSYFLPEDEGVKRAKHKLTVVYANLYDTRFRQISLPLAKEILSPFHEIDLKQSMLVQKLLVWFRGHDIGHSFFLPETNYQKLRALGLEQSIILQETIADVLGYLMIVKGPWQQAFQLNSTECSTIFLAELLRYIRRGPGWFPDSDAAYIELSYLVSHGYVSLIENGGKLAWEPEQLYEGLVILAKELVNIVLRADMARASALLAEHSFHPGHALSGIFTRLVQDFGHIPTVFTYNIHMSQPAVIG